ERDPKLRRVNCSLRRPHLTKHLKSQVSTAVRGEKVARDSRALSSKSVPLGELDDQVGNWPTQQLTPRAERMSSRPFAFPPDCRGFGPSRRYDRSLRFARDHSGSKRNPMASAWTPKISAEKSPSLAPRPHRELTEAPARSLAATLRTRLR